MTIRNLTKIDHLLVNLDQGLRTVFGRPQATGRANPAEAVAEGEMEEEERRYAAGLMRVNHAGEVAAQGLYQGQALTARLPEVRSSMEQAATEENDHLVWCEKRVTELGSHTSLLAPVWYLGAFTIGAVAGASGDKWSLGFLAETEQQVVVHLDGHLLDLPPQDGKSRAIVEQMKEDESRHATAALDAGGAKLPRPAAVLMKFAAGIMLGTAYWT